MSKNVQNVTKKMQEPEIKTIELLVITDSASTQETFLSGLTTDRNKISKGNLTLEMKIYDVKRKVNVIFSREDATSEAVHMLLFGNTKTQKAVLNKEDFKSQKKNIFALFNQNNEAQDFSIARKAFAEKKKDNPVLIEEKSAMKIVEKAADNFIWLHYLDKLSQAIAIGSPNIDNIIAERSYLLTKKDNNGMLPFQFAISIGRFDLFYKLFPGKEYIGERTNDESNVVHLFARNVNSSDSKNQKMFDSILKTLSESKESFFQKNYRGETPFMCAIDSCNIGFLKYFKENFGNVLVEVADYDNNTPLFKAVEKLNIEIVQFLLDCGCDTMKQNNKGWTAFMMAVHFREKDIMKLLIKRMKHINSQDNDGKTAFHLVDKDILQEFVDLLSGEKKRIKYGFFKPNIKDNKGRTAIHALIEMGANVNLLQCIKTFENLCEKIIYDVADINGETPFQIALKIGKKDVIKYLFKKVTDTDRKNIPKYLSYDEFKEYGIDMTEKEIFAAIAQNEKFETYLNYLDKKKFNYNAVINHRINGSMPFLIASKYGNLKFIEKFSSYDVLFTCLDENENNAMHLALANNRENVVDFFLKFFDRITLKWFDRENKEGMTPLAIACEKCLTKLAVSLSEYSNPTENLGNKSPLYIALHYKGQGKEKSVLECIALLLIRKGFRIESNDEKYRELLRYNEDKCTPLHYAVKIQANDFLKICDKEDVNEYDVRHLTPLHYALAKRFVETCKQLLEWDITDYTLPDIEDHTYIHYTVMNNNITILKIIIEKYPDLALMSDNNGWNPLHYAISHNDSKTKEIVSILIKNKDLLSAKTNDGWYPIHLAALKGNQEVMELLIDKIDYKDTHMNEKVWYGNEELSAIGIAYKNQNIGIISLILQTYNGIPILESEPYANEIRASLGHFL